jgi:ribosomal protein S18 acetylase RimI-like enzyme
MGPLVPTRHRRLSKVPRFLFGVLVFHVINTTGLLMCHGFSFSFTSLLSAVSPGISSSSVSKKNSNAQLLFEVVPARIPEDLDAIRTCRATAFGGREKLLDAERSFMNAEAVTKNSKQDSTSSSNRVVGVHQCLVVRERIFPWRILGTADVKQMKTSSTDNIISLVGSGNTKKKYHVNNVFVQKNARGLGLGRLLMEGVEEQLLVLLLAEQEDDDEPQEEASSLFPIRGEDALPLLDDDDKRKSTSTTIEVSLKVDTMNTPAISLYRQCGYTTRPGIHSFVAGISDVTGAPLQVSMIKQLTGGVGAGEEVIGSSSSETREDGSWLDDLSARAMVVMDITSRRRRRGGALLRGLDDQLLVPPQNSRPETLS